MALKVIVWGTGNVGRPAIRAVLSHCQLTLQAVIVSSEEKAGRDAGELAGVEPCGVTATRDWQAIIDQGADAVVYSATADTRPAAAIAEVLACLDAGINVVAPGLYFFLDPASTPAQALAPIEAACARSGASLFTSGIDPGWAMDRLPVVLSGASADIREIRSREIFNYALYDQPRVVREVIGFGQPMDELPMMLHEVAIDRVWSPMLRLLARALGKPVDNIEIAVERRPLEATIDVPGMGLFEQGTQGAFRFTVTGYHGGAPLYVLEHVTRIDDRCAPDWPYPPEGQGCHQVLISGSPRLEVTVHGHDPVEPGVAGGGNASAAAWLVNAIPAVCTAAPGVVTMLDLPDITGAAQLQVE
ncbi:dihydrodipicolinate reductase [Seongchinamella sediminis]|uniref:Dihydrodipicolinate reductase n=1 Tax=Seongchinamella sediminis TaxID=2283635 RepID=A0A3L7DZE0_9GAMM|nr:dihydrodipicolinate reductase [Seongchinamella sediminis]RLQ21202.1 dihydrodipicolinate reductase [Seongchinamella sediminis]